MRLRIAPNSIAANPANWLDARWIDTGTLPGAHLKAGGRLAGHGTNVGTNRVEYVRNAAHLSAIALQRPFRLAVHASSLAQL